MPTGGARATDPPALVVRHLTKSFGAGAGSRALDDVGLTISSGEVHGLLGENGSGKSTLIKVLAGFHQPDTGELEVGGHPVAMPLQAGQSRELAMSFVHQDLALVPSLSVVENLHIEDIAASRNRWRISWADQHARALATFAKYGVFIDPKAKVSDLRSVERALLAIVRAVEGIGSGQSTGVRGLLVLDEPTVFLPKDDVEQLFRLVREIAATGSSVLFVSHDLDEVREITDRVTVLRNGRNVGTVVTRNVDKAELVRLIIGHDLQNLTVTPEVVLGHSARSEQPVKAFVDGLSGGLVRGISFSLHRGEILGLTGLAGSGFEDIPYMLFGANRAAGGTLQIESREWDLRSLTPSAALAAGMAMLPGNRQEDGSIGSLAVSDNVTMQVLKEYFKHLRLQRRQMVAATAQLGRDYDVRPNNPRLTYSSLSGGNQQKALLAKWFSTNPPIVLLHEPTQGVDIGAREQISEVIRQTAKGGTSVLCASSDYEQLANICDRVLVFASGTLVRELYGSDITKERIAEQVVSAVAANHS